jgi:probable rRNA maturation factor
MSTNRPSANAEPSPEPPPSDARIIDGLGANGPMSVRLHVERACDAADLPDDAALTQWVHAALLQGLPTSRPAAVLSLRIVDAAEGAALNRRYRGGADATNVLSFPFDPPDGLPPEAIADLGDELAAQLGDLVICAPVLRREAEAQGKDIRAHTAHLLVHGTLHLIGHDHQAPTAADAMEALETVILAGLGFPSPYAVSDDPTTEPYDERPI